MQQNADIGEVVSSNSDIADIYATDYVDVRLPIRNSDLEYIDLPEIYSDDLSPNKGAAGNYVEPALIKKGEALANTKGFTPDIGDTIPGGFGSAEFKAISDYVNGGDLDSILAALAVVQSEALE